jgi:diguanylate cyclase (GGDEF)-like protein
VKINFLKILLVEDNLADADWLEEILLEANLPNLELCHVQRVKDALAVLDNHSFDAILLDMSLPDSQGIDNITQVKYKVPELPIIVLTALNDQDMAIESVRQGAQDYLIKGRFDKELLLRSIHYAIERQRNEATLRQQAAREKLMAKMLERIHQSLDLQEVLQTTVTEIRQFLEMDRVLIYRYESDNPGKLIVEAFDDNELEQNRDDFGIQDNFVDWHLTSTQSNWVQAIEDTNQEKNIAALAKNQIRAILTLPIWESQSLKEEITHNFTEQQNFYLTKINNLNGNSNNQYRLWGMLVAYNYDAIRKWQEWEINFLTQLTTQVTIAIQQSELYGQLQKVNQQLKQLATLDGLTGVANRRHFDRILSHEWQRLAREQKPLSLILCDIDYFKDYNDAYGHPGGDRCLQQVAKTLQQTIKRPADLVARYGGEEFVIILPDTNPEGSLFIANLIRQELKKRRLAHQKSQVNSYVTLSIGTATLIPESYQNKSILIKMADEALYLAKEQGRDRIVQYK